MILELCQMLWTAFHVTGDSGWERVAEDSGIKVYKQAHKNHPTAIWVRSSVTNFNWTVALGLELCKEYTRRYGKFHACEKMLHWFTENHPRCDEEYVSETAFYSQFSIPKWKGKLCTPPPLAMPEYYHYPDLVESYRMYYNGDKARFAVWNKGKDSKPDWFHK